MTTAREHITDTLNRAQLSFDRMTATVGSAGPEFREAIALFMYHVNTAVLLENIRRQQSGLADLLTDWLCGQDGGIYGDGLAGELLHQWREQLAAGQDMEPIAPSTDGTPA